VLDAPATGTQHLIADVRIPDEGGNGMVDEQPKHDGPPDEPGLESEGIGPIGMIVGGVLEGPVGVAAAWVGEKLIDIPEAYSEWNKEEEHRREVKSTANLAGFEHGLDEAMSQTSIPVPPQYSTGPDMDKTHEFDWHETPTGSFNRGDAEGAKAAADIQASQAGAADGRTDAERHLSSAPPEGYADSPEYQKAYDAAQADAQADEG
jgi:hypothetical protein